jgi:hypothetical protein
MTARLLFSLAAAALAAAAPVELLRPGLYHKGELAPQAAGEWLALAPADAPAPDPAAGYRWRRCAVALEPALDPLVDQDSERTGSEVKVEGARPLFLVRGFDRLERVRVRTALAGKRVTGSLAIDLDGVAYALAAAPSVVLRAGAVAQTLSEWPAAARDARLDLVWAGDLDGDGRLDLLLAASAQGAAVESVLYLSSAAASGRLVEAVARLRTAGD